MIVLSLAVAGCQSSRLEDLAPLPGVRNSGTTPDLNVLQKAETEQFSEQERDAKAAELAAARASQAQSAPPAGGVTAAQLRKARQTQTETLKEIEGE
jgi:hypothetical protein